MAKKRVIVNWLKDITSSAADGSGLVHETRVPHRTRSWCSSSLVFVVVILVLLKDDIDD